MWVRKSEWDSLKNTVNDLRLRVDLLENAANIIAARGDHVRVNRVMELLLDWLGLDVEKKPSETVLKSFKEKERSN